MKLAVYTACLAFLGVSILLGGFGLALSRQIMEVLQTPADVLDMAVDYLNIYFAGCHFCFCTTCSPPCSMHWENPVFPYIS